MVVRNALKIFIDNGNDSTRPSDIRFREIKEKNICRRPQ
jgi:hypothetical protein